MRGHPLDGAPEHRPISTEPKALPSAPLPARVSGSRYPAPKVLMGEVAAPKGQVIAAGRDAFRAFMRKRHLQPSQWARDAGVPPGEVLAFLSGRAREISRASLEKLAATAGAAPEDLLK